MMMHTMQDKVVIITGASMGIGEETALAFAREGAKITLAARKQDLLESVAKKVEAEGGEALVAKTDVANADEVETMVAATIEKWGKIDILINNAGFGMHAPLATTPDKELRQLFDVNVFGSIYCIQAVYPHLKKAGGGQIINVSSIVGLRAIPSITGYCMSKYALNGLSDGLTAEAALDGIDVLSIYPAHTLTNFHDNQTIVGKKREHPKWFAQDAKTVAKAILKASKKKRRDTVMTLSARMMNRVNKLCPRFMDKILTAGYRRYLNH